jgi:hypothetical protein
VGHDGAVSEVVLHALASFADERVVRDNGAGCAVEDADAAVPVIVHPVAAYGVTSDTVTKEHDALVRVAVSGQLADSIVRAALDKQDADIEPSYLAVADLHAAKAVEPYADPVGQAGSPVAPQSVSTQVDGDAVRANH